MRIRQILLLSGLLWGTLVSPLAGQLNTGGRNARLEFQFIEADGFETTDPEISAVVERLSGLFRFDGYRLLHTSVLRGVVASKGYQASRQRVRLEGFGTLEIEAWLHESEDPTRVRIVVRLRDTAGEYVSNGQRIAGPELMDVTVNVRDGQTVILGSGEPKPDSGTLFLVLRLVLED